MIFVRFGYKKSLGSSFFSAWADFHWNCERSFSVSYEKDPTKKDSEARQLITPWPTKATPNQNEPKPLFETGQCPISNVQFLTTPQVWKCFINEYGLGLFVLSHSLKNDALSLVSDPKDIPWFSFIMYYSCIVFQAIDLFTCQEKSSSYLDKKTDTLKLS